MFRCGKILMALALMLTMPITATAQTADKPAAPSTQAQPASPPPPSAELLKPEQLEALVAPIALYPDELLANVLAASTYPLEVVQADRWLKERKTLKGDALKAEVDKQAWDDSVKALASTADVLSMMSDKLEWTKKLGDALLAQQPDVMDAIQRLRTKAYDNKKLVTTKQQKVSVQTRKASRWSSSSRPIPPTIYVPYYDPATVYGAWPYAEYPPYYWGYPSYIGAGVVAAGLAFGTAWAIGRWGNYWGGGCNWGNRNVYVNHRTTNIANGWQHNPAHRGGVRYNNANVQQRFGNNNLRAGASDRMDFRGRDGNQVLRPSQGAGDRAEIAPATVPVIVAVRVTVQEIVPVIAAIVPAIAATGPAAAIVLARAIVPRVVEIAPSAGKNAGKGGGDRARLPTVAAAALPPIVAVAAIAAAR